MKTLSKSFKAMVLKNPAFVFLALVSCGSGGSETKMTASNMAVEEKMNDNMVEKMHPAVSQGASYVYQSWMHEDVRGAWKHAYFGQDTTITFVDLFKTDVKYSGNLDGMPGFHVHGYWSEKHAKLIAPKATTVQHDFMDKSGVSLDPNRFNVVNLSYGIPAPHDTESFAWSELQQSVIDIAHDGSATVVKAAGNDYGTAVDGINSLGLKDYLNVALKGAEGVIYVGALSSNGSVEAPAYIADYSNVAGNDQWVQDHFVVAGVEEGKTQLYGTSFATPIVASYASIIHNKFEDATPTQINERILNTARTDTIANYDPSVHGRGEASLMRALAPVSMK